MPRVCITVHGKNAQPYRFSLERKVVRLGRASDNDIVINCPSVSSHHCEMRRVEGGYILKDSSSTNGIKLDGDKMEIIDLDNGQEILVGDAALDFTLSGEELDDLSKEERVPQQRARLPASGKESRKAAGSRRP
ncbi:MAG: FHA domain-containing protein, partial [Akkermansiaceae bacterium]|nr:FHA domain-containing protein [Akkermansiaceae bacterium]